ncbi:DUF3376 domain-containing protein [Streptomyces lavendulae]|uniref:DUF3376 domain-containing protein n=1 Tax=Streptomyces lavendulae TaxID=1914 RepID=UPI0036B1ABC7
MSTAAGPPRSAELRLAVAMRGGVSLAVWMGGACCEMARLRAAAPGPAEGPPRPGSPGTDVYRRVLERCGYRDVDIDVIAGTSAGGLNGVLLACHLVYGMPYGPGVRDLWLHLGDLESLLRRSTPFHVPVSLMQGDEVFYAGLRRALDELLAEAPDPLPRPAASLRLILTATRLRPCPDRVRPTLGQPLLVGRSTAHFRFRHRRGLTDFPADPTARGPALDRLAYAARTSSSFPGAFEPARPYVGNEPPPPGAPPRVDMRGVSSETGHCDENLGGCAELVDGGLLDNIPVAWAVRAIAGAPVTRPVDRWLLFLQPVPPFPPPPERGTADRATRLVRIAAKSFAVKSGSESLRDDALELRAAAAAARQREAVVAVLPPVLRDLERAGAARADAHRRTAGAAEAARLVRLLEDPADVTGPDPLPLPPGPDPLRPLDEAAGQGSVRLFTGLHAVSGTLLPTPWSTPLAAARAVRLLMDWVRACEAGPAPPDPAAAARCRRSLYAYRFAVATLIAARDRLLLRHYADALAGGALPPDPAAPYREATRALRDLLPALPGTDADPARWHDWATALSAALDRSTAPDPHPAPAAGPAPAGPEDPYAQLWERIGGLGRYVGQSLGDAPADGFRALREAATADGGDGARMTDALTAAEILLGPLRPDPLAEATDISFHTVSAATTSWATRTVLGGAADTSPEELVRAKLSGNQSANFAAFLSARWRLGDWTWGRLDAAASLVAVVATDERLAAAFGAATDDADLGARVAATMPPGSGFARLWAEDLGLRPDLPRWDRVRDLLAALRQREILDEELPLIAALDSRGIRAGNRPDLPADPPPLPEGGAAFERALAAFRAIGAEDVSRLVRVRDPRRAALRTGLLVWPAVQPSGRAAAHAVQGVLGLLKPLVWLMPLVCLLAPASALAAVALMWTGAAFGSGRWSSLPAHVPLCAFAMTALGAAVARLRPRWPLPAVLAAGSVALSLPPLALALARPYGAAVPGGAPARLLVVGPAYALACALVLRIGAARPWYTVAAAAVAGGALACAVPSGQVPQAGWWAALALYLVLLWITFVLPWLYPDAAPRAEPSDRVNR